MKAKYSRKINIDGSDEMPPLITVLMSVYNGEKWLRDAIESVLNQSFLGFEFIIINDGSSDNSSKIIEQYAAKDHRIVVFNKPNTGLADSLNYGIQNARGVWIARIDADDICEISRLEKQIKFVKENPRHIYVGAGLTIIDGNGRKFLKYSYPEHHSQLVNRLLTLGAFPPHSSAFYLTQAAISVGGYRPRIKCAEDWDLWLRLSEVGQLGSVKEQLVQCRQHSGQITREESGAAHLVDSRIATISYWLRSYQQVDPVDESEKEFQFFSEWIQDRLISNKFFEIHAHGERLKLLLLKSMESPLGLIKFSTVFLFNPALSFFWIVNRVLGGSNIRRLAFEWSHLS